MGRRRDPAGDDRPVGRQRHVARAHLLPAVVYDDYCGSLVFVSEDGARIVFETTEKLVPADTDEKIDVYQRAGGVTTLLSPARPDREPVYGERDFDVFFVDASLNASIAYLESEEQLTADDTNLRKDGVRVHPPAPGAVVPGLGGSDPGAPAAGGVAPAAGVAPSPAGASAPPQSAARLRLAARPRALRLARGKTRLDAARARDRAAADRDAGVAGRRRADRRRAPRRRDVPRRRPAGCAGRRAARARSPRRARCGSRRRAAAPCCGSAAAH